MMAVEAIKKYANGCAERAVAAGDDSEAKRLWESHDMGVLSDAEFAAIAELTQAYIQCRSGDISRRECTEKQISILQNYDKRR